MAKEGKKLELYEVLAAKRAKGKVPLGLDVKVAKQANAPAPEVTDRPGVIIDDAVAPEAHPVPRVREERKPEPQTPQPQPTTAPAPANAAPEPVPEAKPEQEEKPEPAAEREPAKSWFKGRQARPTPPPQPAPPEYPEPEPPPRRKSPRELVFSLDLALVFFLAVLGLVTTAFFIGYKRGREEKPTGLAGLAEIDTMDPERLPVRELVPLMPTRPPEQGFTLIIRREPATDELPERLEYELAEALNKGRSEAGQDFPGFIFRTEGKEPYYILAVGVGRSSNDPELNKLLHIYNSMDGISLSRQPKPYLGSRVASIGELGTPVL